MNNDEDNKTTEARWSVDMDATNNKKQGLDSYKTDSTQTTSSDSPEELDKSTSPSGLQSILKSTSKTALILLLPIWILFFVWSFYLQATEPEDSVYGLVVTILGFFLFLASVIVVIFSVGVKLVYSSPKTRKQGLIAFSSVLVIATLSISLIIWNVNRPLSREEALSFINNCEIYNVTQDSEDRVIINYKDKSIKRKTNEVDPRHMDEYVRAAESNENCSIQTHEIKDRVD